MFTRLTNERAFILLVLLVFVLLGLMCYSKTSVAQDEDWPVEPILPMCPVDFHECVERDFVAELERAHMLDPNLAPIGVWVGDRTSDRRREIDDWELAAIDIIMNSGAIGKDWNDILTTDGGAHGFAHFQPPNGLDLEELEIYEYMEEVKGDIHWIDQIFWVEHLETILYSPYSAAIQLRAWRSTVNHAVYGAQRNGWEDEELVIAASIANSTGERGFLNLAEECGWDPAATIQGYMDQRPDSNHRRRRARRLQLLL